ncbi:tetratricopeptide repeat-containing sensor histidine kinase [Maribacter aestuarii]|uniref:tetratricopeptide repeat-containing sensor histidine kinase n=1 Tax=Maribacter aestuarii TaxID=1130723 RepID=UPI0025A62EB9|nr:tetratricopeptide repeat-containing sensor histidine kinase [Maribacter aestuarii]
MIGITTFQKGIILLVLLFSLQSNGQYKVDRFELLLEKSKEQSLSKSERLDALKEASLIAQDEVQDSLKLRFLSKLSLATLKRGDSILFRQTNNKTLELAKKNGDSIILAEAYWDLATFFNKSSIKDSAYYSYSEAQKIFEAKKDLFSSGRMFYNMGQHQSDVRDYIGSETAYIAAIERLKPLNKYKQLYKSYDGLGIVANALGEQERALKYYKEARFYLEKMGKPKLLITSNTNNVGIVNRDNGNYQEAIEKFKEVLSTDSLKQKDAILYAKALNNLALCKIRVNDTSGVLQLINNSIKLKDSIGNISSLASSYFTLAEYRLMQSDTINSISNAKKAVALSKESSNNDRLLETLAFLAQIDAKKASSYAQHYIRLNDSLQQEERQARNKFARIRFETDEFIAENEVLAEQKELLSKEKRMWTGIAVGFFLLGLSVYVIINQRVKNQKLVFQQQQQANNQEIFNLMLAQKQKVDEVKRMEQKRISEELHDGVLGKMLGARMVLTGLNKKSDADAIKERSEAINALKNVENEVRSISHELSHTAYQKLSNFVSSIETLLTTAKENVDLNTSFSYEEDEDWDSLKGDIKINVYRIIQETLQNSIKHSNCENFFINFERDEDFFNLIIRDDGKGFKSNKEKKGIGIRNITSRVSKLNGTWTLDTAPGKGTLISIKIPITSNPSVEESNKGHLESV